MITQKLPSFWIFLWLSMVLCLIGWGGLVMLVFLTLPTLAPRWLFFFLLTLALSGTGLPVVYLLNRRFPTDPPVDGSVILRESMWFGVYGSLLAWLQAGRVFAPGLALVLAVGLILVEFLLRLGDRATWLPGRAATAPAAPESADELDDEYD